MTGDEILATILGERTGYVREKGYGKKPPRKHMQQADVDASVSSAMDNVRQEMQAKMQIEMDRKLQEEREQMQVKIREEMAAELQRKMQEKREQMRTEMDKRFQEQTATMLGRIHQG